MSASKRDELVHKALDIFYRDGFHSTGMDTLVKETGISKTSMYKHFRTKEDLILAALRLRDEKFRNFIFRRIDDLGKTPKEKLLATFDVLAEWFEMKDFRGCMFVKASGEYPEHNSPILNTAAEHKNLLIKYLSDLAREAGAKDPENLATQILILKEGATVLAHMKGPGIFAQQAKEVATPLISAACD